MRKNIPYEKSFASHPRSVFWSNKNEYLPKDYMVNSHKICWFNCQECGHEFSNSLKQISQQNSWCQYCTHKKLCENDNCNMCFNNLFASHPKSIYWHSSNSLTPKQVFKNSHLQYNFQCDKCNHIFSADLASINSKNTWCYYCSHHKLCNDLNCEMCYNSSFASVERSKYLSDKTINPRNLFKNSAVKYSFDCYTCNSSFSMRLSHVTNFAWCSYCYNKTECKLYNELSKHYLVDRQFKANWCKNAKTNKYLPYDFAIEEFKLIIELDGIQHFKQVGNWTSPKLIRKNDIYKMNCANKNGYSIIRILQDDVFYNKYNWLEELLENINKVKTKEIIQNIYMCKKDEYLNFNIEILDVDEEFEVNI